MDFNMIELYDYQKQYINKLRQFIKQGKNRIVLCAPTGAGKTVMFSFMVSEHLKKGGNVIVFTHRSELLIQAGGTFDNFGLKAEYITSETKPNLEYNLHVAMVETFNRRVADYEIMLARKTLIIIDEAHLQNFTKIMSYINKKSIVIGATATPYRKPKEVQMSEFYEDIAQELDTQDVINLGKLTPAKSYGVPINLAGLKKKGNDYDTASYYSENELYKGVVKNYKKYSENKKTILFASNIKSSKEVCFEFEINGYEAKHIDGKTKDRENILKWFNDTPNAILCNCGVLTAGFDQSDIDTVILYRATTSLPLFLQMCGRGSRIHNDKKHFNILDFGNNIKRLGFWEDRREWSLKYELKNKKESEQPIKECPECSFMMPASSKECPECGYEYPKKEKTNDEIILEELKRIETKGKRISELSIDDMITLQQSKKLKSHFVWRVMRNRGKSTLSIYANKMRYSKGWYDRQLENINDNDFKDFVIR